MIFHNADQCAFEIINKVGKKIVVATPLGLGKPIQLLNALYRAALTDPTLELTILTALSFFKPRPKDELSKRLMGPIFDRIYGDYEDLLYEVDRRQKNLPKNVNIIEFFLEAGAYLENPLAQRSFISSNYTHALRTILQFDVNVIASLIAVSPHQPHIYSLSCNADLIMDLIQAQTDAVIVGEINKHLPFTYGPGAILQEHQLDFVLQNKGLDKKLFCIPKTPLSEQDHMIGLHVSSLIKDDGTLQIGIGNLADAITYALILRHKHNRQYQEIMASLGPISNLGQFTRGLFASTEMFVDSFLELIENDIVKRKVTDEYGTFTVHAGFFAGSNSFYERLRGMSEASIKNISMRSIQEINQLYGDEIKRREQRKNARFINTCLKASLLGDISSDALYDGQTISGVGGQYNFVAMAHELLDGRSIIMVRSTRNHQQKISSNIVMKTENVTIPRHLRDIVVSEYGIADVRGKTDEEVIKSMLNIADSRFQSQLLKEAKTSQKIAPDYEIPKQYRNNFPKNITNFIDQYKQLGLFPQLPFGHEFTDDELVLMNALSDFKKQSIKAKLGTIVDGMLHRPREKENQLLLRMELLKAAKPKEIILRALVLGAIKTAETVF